MHIPGGFFFALFFYSEKSLKNNMQTKKIINICFYNSESKNSFFMKEFFRLFKSSLVYKIINKIAKICHKLFVLSSILSLHRLAINILFLNVSL